MNLSTYQLKNYYSWGIKALIFIIPLLSFWIATPFYFPYITGRNFAFRILIEIALVLWTGLIVLDKEYRPRFTPILTAVLVFLGIVGLADLLGVNPYKSFWSNFERMEGYIAMLHFVAYFVMLTSVFREKRDWLILFNFFATSSVLIGFYGVLQKLGLKASIQGGEARIDGTIGNPTYLAAYLILTTAIVFILFFNSQKRWQKYLYGSVIIFNFLILYFTASRGPVLGAGVALVLFSLLYLIVFKKDAGEKIGKRVALSILIAAVIVPSVFFAIRKQEWVQSNLVLSRFASISIFEKTVKSRFMIWGVSWKAFKERPILGWGQENYMQAFSKYYNPKLFDQEPWFDRSHNIIFDWLIHAGILGLISYLSLFVLLFSGVIWAAGKNFINKKESLILIVAPVAYFIQNLFVFDNFNTYVLFFTILAYVNSARNSGVGYQAVNPRYALGASLAAILLILPIIYFINIKPAAQAKGIITSLIATTDTKDPVGLTLKSFKKAFSYNTFGNAEVLEQFTQTAKSLMDQDNIDSEAKLGYFQSFLPDLENYLKRFPNDIRLHLFLADLYQSAVSLDRALISRARDHFKAALELSPAKQQIYSALANNYLINGEIEKAFELLNQALAIEPSNSGVRANKSIVAILMGKNDIVQAEIIELGKIKIASEKINDPNALPVYLESLEKIANMYLRVEQLDNARLIYKELVRVAPTKTAFAETLKDLEGE